MSERFTGFTAEGFAFLAGLDAENTRTYFDTNRKTYEQGVKTPMQALVVAVAAELQKSVSPGLKGEPKVGKSLFRINRDTRFARDKTPYNPWVDAIWWEGSFPPRQAPVFLLRIAADHVFVGSGIMGMRGEMLDRYRKAVANDRSGPALQDALEGIVDLHPDIEISEPTRKRVPSGYPQDHPRGMLLKLDTLHASRRYPIPAEARTPHFPAWLSDKFADHISLHRWLVENLTPDS